MNKKRSSGFTLIEMIIVMAIIAILTSLAIPQAKKYMDRANKSKVIAAAVELNNNLLMYQVDNQDKVSNDIKIILNEIGKLDRLNINLDENGNFEIGNIKGSFLLVDNEIFVEISSDSKAFPGEKVYVR